MIHTSRQLKDKVRNISNGDNAIATVMIRNFMMERFLERVSISKYRNNFILKGGMLVASIIGISMRTTMDIDMTVKALPLNMNDTQRIIQEICNIILEDGVNFKIISTKEIMEDFDYPGIRMMIEGTLDRMKQPIKIDISTDDVITPEAVKYEYKLMFEDRKITLQSYNIETLLAEKMQTILSRGLANTRMRDFYDVYEILKVKHLELSNKILKEAFIATCQKRETIFTKDEALHVLTAISDNKSLIEMWDRFKEEYYFVGDITWKDINICVVTFIDSIY